MDTDYGEFVEMNEQDPGFDEAMSIVGGNLPRIDPAWPDRAKAL